MITLDGGARAETDKYPAGLAHFLEHCCFKGTDKRTYSEISRDIAFLGGSFNAFTSFENVNFYISVPYEHVEKAAEILSDFVLHSTFPEAEVIKEIDVVKEEEISTKDDVDGFIYDTFSKEFFSGKAAVPIIGTQETISTFTRDHLVSFRDEFYQDGIVTLCGNHNKKTADKILTKYFGESKRFKKQTLADKPSYKDQRVISVSRPGIEHDYVWLCYPGRSISKKPNLSDSFVTKILGSGMDSRLFNKVREEQGLCYGISCETFSQRDYSANLVSTSTRSKNIEKMIESIKAEVKLLKTEYVSEEEIERTKNKMRAHMYARTESSYAMARMLSDKAFFGISKQPLEKSLEKVTKASILESAQAMFDDSKELLLVCGKE